jgi:hypothetical protein
VGDSGGPAFVEPMILESSWSGVLWYERFLLWRCYCLYPISFTLRLVIKRITRLGRFQNYSTNLDGVQNPWLGTLKPDFNGWIYHTNLGWLYFHLPREITFGVGVITLVNGFGYPIRLFHLSTAILRKVLSGCISCLNLPMAQLSELTIMLPAVGKAIRSSVWCT